MPIDVTSLDRVVRAWIMAHQNNGVHGVADIVSKVGGVSPVDWVGILFAIYLWLRGRRPAALAVAISPLLALLTYTGARRLLFRQRPPSGAGLHEASSSFPSAHSTTATAVCCTLAYILWRERMIPAPIAIFLAVLPPLVIGASRLYLDVHWTTDVIAGWIAGLLIAALAAVFYRQAGSIQNR
jgi:undecaprenyl-diphosphatase